MKLGSKNVYALLLKRWRTMPGETKTKSGGLWRPTTKQVLQQPNRKYDLPMAKQAAPFTTFGSRRMNRLAQRQDSPRPI